MTDRTWPTLSITFPEPPESGEWEAFLGMVHVELEPLGLEETGDINAPSGARVFFPSQDGAVPGLAEERRARLTKIALSFFPTDRFRIKVEQLADRDWGHEWRRYFKTMRVGERLYAGPPWEGKLPEDAPEDALLILIDPGQAFGTGSHETTQLCLQLLEKYVEPGGCLLDVGTGSGILAIGAVLLGEGTVIGTEYDPVCEENFVLNAKLNAVAGRIHFFLSGDPVQAVEEARAKGLPEPGHVICNMLSERFYPLLAGLRVIGKPMILSGFLQNETESVAAALKEAGFVVRERYALDEWCAWVCDVN